MNIDSLLATPLTPKAKAKRRHVTLRLPENLVQYLDYLAEVYGLSRTEVAESILAFDKERRERVF